MSKQRLIAAFLMVVVATAAMVAPGESGLTQADATSLSFDPPAIALENDGAFATVDIVVADLAADEADTAQINIQHGADFTITNVACGPLYSGGSASGAISVSGGTAFTCSLQNGPLSDPGNVVASFDITKVGETTGETVLDFLSLASDPFRTTFFEAGSEVLPGTLNSLSVWDQLEDIGPQSVDENAAPLIFNVTSVDATSTLTHSVTPANGTLVGFVDNGDGTGTFTITPTFDDGGVYTIDVMADNGVVGTETFTLTVDEVNRAPVLTEITPDPQIVAENGTLPVPLVATDPDGDGLAFTATIQLGAGPIVAIPDGVFSTITDNGNGTGTLNFNPGFDDAGTYTVVVTVTDDSGAANGVLDDADTFTLTVNDTNRLPTVNPVTPQSVVEGGTPLDVAISGSDIDGQAITLSATIDGDPIPIGFSTISATVSDAATLTFSPPLGTVSTDQIFSIVVTASDGIDDVTTSFDLTVTNVAEIIAPAGTVSLQGVDPGATHDAQFAAIGPSVDLVLAADGAAGTAVDTVAVGVDGSFYFSGMAEDVYLLRISAPGYLTHVLGDILADEIDVTSADFDLGPSGANKPVTMLGGLVVAGNTAVEMLDTTPLMAVLFTTPSGGSSPRQDSSDNWVDLNGDGVVNGQDVSIITNNIGLSGNQPWL